MSRRVTRATRGLVWRLLGVCVGITGAGALIVGMILAIPLGDVQVRLQPVAVTASAIHGTVTWPSTGQAAWALSGSTGGWHDHTPAPIASLTKMMTALVVLDALPLAVSSSGPCLTTTEEDAASYRMFAKMGQSRALVTAGEQLCEHDLLAGLLIHSAGNYGPLLVKLTGLSSTAFVGRMNTFAQELGLRKTHYVDVSGFDSRNVSTAGEQIKVAQHLMSSPVIRSLVRQTWVTLPMAGTLNSFTPLVGVGGVIGVKSGRTDAAGGCDVMAVVVNSGDRSRVIYAAVLGQRGGDLVTPAGAAAFAIARDLQTVTARDRIPKGTVVGHVSWQGHAVSVAVSHSIDVTWKIITTPPETTVIPLHIQGPLVTGKKVGILRIGHRAVSLVATGELTAPSLWQRLR